MSGKYSDYIYSEHIAIHTTKTGSCNKCFNHYSLTFLSLLAMYCSYLPLHAHCFYMYKLLMYYKNTFLLVGWHISPPQVWPLVNVFPTKHGYTRCWGLNHEVLVIVQNNHENSNGSVSGNLFSSFSITIVVTMNISQWTIVQESIVWNFSCWGAFLNLSMTHE